jgi:hypothetical protein
MPARSTDSPIESVATALMFYGPRGLTARDSDRSLSSQYAILANASVIGYFVDM